MAEDRTWGLVALVALVLACVPLFAADLLSLEEQPFSDAVQYVTAAEALSEGRYDVDVPGRDDPPRYPPGLPIVLAPAAALGGVGAIQTASLGLSLLLVASVWWAARRLGGNRAAAVAGVLMFLSPFPAATGRMVMSDAFAAALTVLALVAVTYGRRVLAGVLIGYSAAVRLACVAGAASFVALRAWRGLAALALVVAGLAAFQWVQLGSVTGGYSDDAAFSLQYFAERADHQDSNFSVRDDLWDRPLAWEYNREPEGLNLWYYARMLFWRWVFLPPLVGLIGVWELWRRRTGEVGRWAAVLAGSNVAIYLVYFAQSARFVAPAGAVLTVFAAVGIARLGSNRVADDDDARAAVAAVAAV